MININQLKNKFLVAMPSLHDPHFGRSVVYICEHHKNGALGIVINKPVQNLSLGDVLRQMQMQVSDERLNRYPVFSGGPVNPDQGFILHHQANFKSADLNEQKNEIFISSSKQDLSVIASGKMLNNILVSLGYASWDQGQLEAEIMQNYWLAVPVDLNIIFSTPIMIRWHKALQLIGVDASKLSNEVGHA